MVHVLYLDRYHLGDPLFLNGLARDVLAFPAPLVLVHGGGEAAERALEAQGFVPAWRSGVLAAESEAERALVERAARDLNRRIAHALNEAGVPSVRLDASSRGLFEAGEGGLETKNVAWLVTLVSQGAVPVMAALGGGGSHGAREVNGGEVAGRLAAAFASAGREARVVMLVKSGLNGPESSDPSDPPVRMEELPEAAVPEPEALRAALGTGSEVRLVRRAELRVAASRGVEVAPGVDNKSA